MRSECTVRRPTRLIQEDSPEGHSLKGGESCEKSRATGLIRNSQDIPRTSVEQRTRK